MRRHDDTLNLGGLGSLQVADCAIPERSAYFHRDVSKRRVTDQRRDERARNRGTGLTRFTSARFTLAARNKYGKSITRLGDRRRGWGTREGEGFTGHAVGKLGERGTQSRGACARTDRKRKKGARETEGLSLSSLCLRATIA